MAKRANWAALETYRLAKEARSETVKLRAIRAILADMMAVSKFSGLECRMADIEEQLRARVDDANQSGPPVEVSSGLVGH